MFSRTRKARKPNKYSRGKTSARVLTQPTKTSIKPLSSKERVIAFKKVSKKQQQLPSAKGRLQARVKQVLSEKIKSDIVQEQVLFAKQRRENVKVAQQVAQQKAQDKSRKKDKRLIQLGIARAIKNLRFPINSSSNVYRVSYDLSTKIMLIEYHAHGPRPLYAYYNVLRAAYDLVLHGKATCKTEGESDWGKWEVNKFPSTGAAVHWHIKILNYQYERLKSVSTGP